VQGCPAALQQAVAVDSELQRGRATLTRGLVPAAPTKEEQEEEAYVVVQEECRS